MPDWPSPLLTAFASGGAATLAHADDLIGQASIVDGDTLEIQATRIRLWRIDAPEEADKNLYDKAKQHGPKANCNIPGPFTHEGAILFDTHEPRVYGGGRKGRVK